MFEPERACHDGLVTFAGIRSYKQVLWGGLEAKLAMRRLPPSLPRVPFLFVEQLNRWGGDGLVDITAAEARAVGTVPIAFHNHGATTAGARPGKRSVHRGSPSKARPGRFPPHLAGDIRKPT